MQHGIKFNVNCKACIVLDHVCNFSTVLYYVSYIIYYTSETVTKLTFFEGCVSSMQGQKQTEPVQSTLSGDGFGAMYVCRTLNHN